MTGDVRGGLVVVHTDRLRHNSETSHRLPHLEGKCRSLHGHSWWIDVTVGFPALDRSIGVEFGEFKTGLRGWIDTYIDHGVILGAADPLVPVLAQFPEIKVFRFGAGADAAGAEELACDLEWPTVENVAVLMDRVAAQVLAGCRHADGGWVKHVDVTETFVNAATLERPAAVVLELLEARNPLGSVLA